MIVRCFERVEVPLGHQAPTVRETEIRATEPLDFEPAQRLWGSDDKWTRYKLPRRGETVFSEIHELTDSVGNGKELPQQCRGVS